MQKTADLLEDVDYGQMTKYTTKSMGCIITDLLKESSLP
jgi:hypothetical protein